MDDLIFEELTLISARQNSRFKNWNRLNTTQGIKKQGLLIIEGLRSCLTAIEHHVEIVTILFSNDSMGEYIFEKVKNWIFRKKFNYNQIFRLAPGLFNAVADVKNPQGIIFIIKKPNLVNLANWLSSNAAVFQAKDKQIKLALFDQLADPGNVGTMIRTAHAFDFTGIVLSEGTVDPYNPKLMRATMGSLFALDLISLNSHAELANLAKQYQLQILISDLDGEPLPEFKLDSTFAGFVLTIGNEAHGLSDSIKQIADHNLTITMPGDAESLNAAIAFGIMAYHLNQSHEIGDLK
ncbi:MAG: RNA methyltransferase [Clostridiaceae bacterium]|nr:RNA methyltransferase [Clostridiaceae bacterium]